MIHLLPVWLYLFGCLTVFIRYQNTSYIVTDQAVYISDGVISRHFNRKPFAELSAVDLHIGIIDRMIGVGDIVMSSTNSNAGAMYGNGRKLQNNLSICDIREYQEVYKIIRDLQTDVFADVQYPNAYRPECNPGYNTKYEKGGKPDYQEEYFNKLDNNK
ncbi:MAG: PH domain-containing protein [Elusimicrobiaceae bacterium]|nr:PH domain-containing protein [Elusimicrobiaceae bacterium]